MGERRLKLMEGKNRGRGNEGAGWEDKKPLKSKKGEAQREK